MPLSSPHLLCTFFVFGGLLAGCTTIPAPSQPGPLPLVGAVPQQAPELVPVVRQGRYTLVELVSEPAQRDLMQQVVEVAIPPTFDASVGDAMRHVLQRTGYRLCDAADATALYGLPLPAAHLRLGPLALRDALLTLAGPGWDLSVDDVFRQVCFRRRAAPTSPGSTAVPTDHVPCVDRIEADGTRKAQK